MRVFDFWRGLKKFDLVQEIAKQHLRYTEPTLGIERNLFTHSVIHSKLRNRPAPDRVDQLVHIFIHNKNMNKEGLNNSTHIEDVLVNMGNKEAEYEQLIC